jgi:hypothetical protein
MRNHRSVLRAHAASRAVYALEQQVCLSSLSAFVDETAWLQAKHCSKRVTVRYPTFGCVLGSKCELVPGHPEQWQSVILVCGPSGSGNTTARHSSRHDMNRPHMNIWIDDDWR